MSYTSSDTTGARALLATPTSGDASFLTGVSGAAPGVRTPYVFTVEEARGELSGVFRFVDCAGGDVSDALRACALLGDVSGVFFPEEVGVVAFCMISLSSFAKSLGSTAVALFASFRGDDVIFISAFFLGEGVFFFSIVLRRAGSASGVSVVLLGVCKVSTGKPGT